MTTPAARSRALRGHLPHKITCVWCGKPAVVRAANARYHLRCQALAAQARKNETRRSLARERSHP